MHATGHGDPVDGKQLAANLKAEAHFTGSGAFGDAAELAGFLAHCAQAHRATKGIKPRAHGYQASCAAHGAKGLAIPRPHLPPRLLRYTMYKGGALDMVEQILGKVARLELERGRLSPEQAFERVARRWAASKMKPTAMLGRDVVWATFTKKKGTPRHDAEGMRQALALSPPTAPTFLLELAYATDSVNNHRFPTVADAGLTDRFRPAREVPPDPMRGRSCWGWTEPLGPLAEAARDRA